MYFPYLRGRMYELIALKELVIKGLLGKSIIPVVEPIKITSTFDSMLNAFDEANLKLAVIYNPEVGDLSSAPNRINSLHEKLSSYKSVLPTVLMNEDADSTVLELESKMIHRSNILIILDKRDFVENYTELFEGIFPKYTLAPDERQIRRSIKYGKVLFEDKFTKQDKNSDYLKNKDEHFSEDHLYYSEEGYEGFGDYSIIGNEYVDGGFAPRAVAIHIVYFDKNNALRI